MFTINSVTRISDTAVLAVATIAYDDGATLDVSVQVEMPQTSDDIIRAVQQRHDLEVWQYNSKPVIDAIVEELSDNFVAQASDSLANIKRSSIEELKTAATRIQLIKDAELKSEPVIPSERISGPINIVEDPVQQVEP